MKSCLHCGAPAFNSRSKCICGTVFPPLSQDPSRDFPPIQISPIRALFLVVPLVSAYLISQARWSGAFENVAFFGFSFSLGIWFAAIALQLFLMSGNIKSVPAKIAVILLAAPFGILATCCAISGLIGLVLPPMHFGCGG